MSQSSLPAQLILFDLDGVLLDSKRNMEIAWQAVRDKHKVELPFAAYFDLIGRPFADIMQVLGLAPLLPEIERTYRIASLRHIDSVDWYEGAAEMLAQAAAEGFKLGIVTSKDTARTQSLLALLPVDFCTVQTPTHRLRGKPAPDHLLMACVEAQIDPGDAVYVGDMISDYHAARRAGIRYLHAAWGYGGRPDAECLAVQQVSQLLPLFSYRSSP